ncbi:hypothetical protein CYY_003767 [Polysphondylium violaceum]|uniref:Alpha/beta hydrolase fold-3 domain-containing protein n=1 Tax=Polysphondylium violaceum TaxID=133409 RepID=A0A8J4PZ82_9MYCE|nr:hypothetical protein CYY_003767 [Polysphondylium violaceum]
MSKSAINYFLEKEAKDLCDATSVPPYLYQLGPSEARKTLNKLQEGNVYKFPCDIEDKETDLGQWGKINVRTLRPSHSGSKKLPVVMYIHGAGWVLGNAHTHDKLVREICHRTQCAVVVPEYCLAPEKKYPTQIEQCFEVLKRIVQNADKENFDIRNLIVAGDSVGGGMATIMCIMSKMRNGPKIYKQLLYYPVTQCGIDTDSYHDFGVNYYLTTEAMKWFWNEYCPENQRKEITASPLYSTKEQLSGLPECMILNGETDVLRDEGEQYGRRLREAGVKTHSIRFGAMIHDFVMLNSLDQCCATRSAMDVSCGFINSHALPYEQNVPKQ